MGITVAGDTALYPFLRLPEVRDSNNEARLLSPLRRPNCAVRTAAAKNLGKFYKGDIRSPYSPEAFAFSLEAFECWEHFVDSKKSLVKK